MTTLETTFSELLIEDVSSEKKVVKNVNVVKRVLISAPSGITEGLASEESVGTTSESNSETFP